MSIRLAAHGASRRDARPRDLVAAQRESPRPVRPSDRSVDSTLSAAATARVRSARSASTSGQFRKEHALQFEGNPKGLVDERLVAVLREKYYAK